MKQKKPARTKEEKRRELLRGVLAASLVLTFILLAQQLNAPSAPISERESYYDQELASAVRDCYAMRHSSSGFVTEYEAGTHMTVKALLRGTSIPENEVRFRTCTDAFSKCDGGEAVVEYAGYVTASVAFDGGVCYIDFGRFSLPS